MVLEANNVKEFNFIQNDAVYDCKPIFCIRADYAKPVIHYNMYATNRLLSDVAVKKIEEIYIEMGFKSSYYPVPKDEIVCSAGKKYSISLGCELEICREYAPKVRDIVFNKLNWRLTKDAACQMIINGWLMWDYPHLGRYFNL